jgi:hypothetical protein
MVYLTGIEIMYRVIRNKLVFALLFIVLSAVELGQFSYAQYDEQTKPGNAVSAILTSNR